MVTGLTGLNVFFAGMCVLAGCDFLSSVPGIGIKWAHSLVLKYKNLDQVTHFTGMKC